MNYSTQTISVPKMHRPMMLTAAIIFFAFFSISPDVQAQTEPPKVEIGGHVSVLHLQGKQQIFEKTAVGGGLRGTFNLNAGLALEGEVNFYPEINSNPIIVDSKAVTGLFGVKAGWRSKKMGFFGKIRPGLLHFEEKIDPRMYLLPLPRFRKIRTLRSIWEACLSCIPPAASSAIRPGDTIIRFRYRSFLIGDRSFTNHNLQFNVGIGFRFF
ncbi:MAG: hypothetical protein IPL01_20860 [Acidobacteria bacterium]|nr:hypothetical protein [Acidobacteriota bacterium]